MASEMLENFRQKVVPYTCGQRHHHSRTISLAHRIRQHGMYFDALGCHETLFRGLLIAVGPAAMCGMLVLDRSGRRGPRLGSGTVVTFLPCTISLCAEDFKS